MKKVLRNLILLIPVAMLAISCSGGNTQDGEGDIGGTYAVINSSCSFATLGNTLELSESGEVKNLASARAMGSDSDIGQPVESADVDTDDDSSLISISVTYEGSNYDCSGEIVDNTISITCTCDSDICSMELSLIDSDSDVNEPVQGVISTPVPDEVSGGGSVPEQMDDPDYVTGHEVHVGTYCYAGGSPILAAIYINEDLDIFISNPETIDDQFDTGVIDYVPAEDIVFLPSEIIFDLPNNIEAVMHFYLTYTQISYVSYGEASLSKVSQGKAETCEGIGDIADFYD